MTNKKMINKKKIAVGVILLAALILLASTFAWFSAQDRVENKFVMDTFGVKITDKFNPDGNVIEPGAEISKEIGVINTSPHKDSTAVARIKLEESLQKLVFEGNDPRMTYSVSNEYEKDGMVKVTLHSNVLQNMLDGGYAVAEINPNKTFDPQKGIIEQLANDDVVLLKKTTVNYTGTTDEYLAFRVVDADKEIYWLMTYIPEGQEIEENNLHAKDKEANPIVKTGYFYAYYTYGAEATGIHGGTTGDINHGTASDGKDLIEIIFADSATTDWKYYDGYYYYTKVIKGGEETTPLTKSVYFNPEMGNEYKGAIYKLTPNMDAVQGYYEAIQAEWGLTKAQVDAIGITGVTTAP